MPLITCGCVPQKKFFQKSQKAEIPLRKSFLKILKRQGSVLPFQLNFMGKIDKDLDHGYICINGSKVSGTPCLIAFKGIKKREH